MNQLFSPDEAQLILSIPITGSDQPDFLIWRGTAKGIFSVRSAYHMQHEIEMARKAMGPSGNILSGVWGKLWNLPIPNPEKNFMWRACHDILPTRANLFKQKIIESPKCPICEQEEETTIHILWLCPSAMDVWNEGARIFQKCSYREPNFLLLVEKMLQRCDAEEFMQFVGIARRILLRRNDLVYGGNFWHPAEIIRHMQSARLSYNVAHAGVHTTRETGRQLQWLAPPTGWIMANWDASVDRPRGIWGMGVIVRNSAGDLMAARCCSRMGYLEPTDAEALAALEATQICRNLGYDWVKFVGDAKAIVEGVNSDEQDWSKKGNIIDGIRSTVQGFTHWTFSHFHREANQVAHELARLAITQNRDELWFSNPPNCIQRLIASEKGVIPA